MRDFKITLGPGVEIGIHDLLDDNLLVIAMRRSGKTMRLRSIAEQVGKHMPIYVIDHDGELVTLREELPIVICGDGGEVPARVETAGALAKRLVQIGASAVLDISTLTRKDKRLFVAAFLQALVHLPRKQWGPRLIFLTEIHEFCPQGGKDVDSQARESINQLLALGGKRGLGCVADTQRIAKLDKDSAAEFGNVCVGRTTLGADVARACERLDFARDMGPSLKKLKKGQMYAAGTSFEFDGAKLFQGTLAKTTHPASAGQRRALKPPPASRSILKFAAELKDLQKEADDEKNELEALRAEVKALRAKKPVAPTRSAPPAAPTPAPKIDTSVYVLQGREDVCRMLQSDLAVVAEKIAAAKISIFSVEKTLNDALHTLHATRPKPAQLAKAVATAAKQAAVPSPKANGRMPHAEVAPTKPAPRRTSARKTTGSAERSSGPRRILTVLAQHPDGLEPEPLRMFAQIGSKNSLRTWVGSLITEQCVTRDGKKLRITETGFNALGDYEELPRGQALVDHWLDWCGNGGPRKILQAALDAGADGIAKDDLLVVAEIGSANSLRTWVGSLTTARLIESFREDGQTRVRAVAALLEAAAT